jgi:hypothetical protein
VGVPDFKSLNKNKRTWHSIPHPARKRATSQPALKPQPVKKGEPTQSAIVSGTAVLVPVHAWYSLKLHQTQNSGALQ